MLGIKVFFLMCVCLVGDFDSPRTKSLSYWYFSFSRIANQSPACVMLTRSISMNSNKYLLPCVTDDTFMMFKWWTIKQQPCNNKNETTNKEKECQTVAKSRILLPFKRIYCGSYNTSIEKNIEWTQVWLHSNSTKLVHCMENENRVNLINEWSIPQHVTLNWTSFCADCFSLRSWPGNLIERSQNGAHMNRRGFDYCKSVDVLWPALFNPIGCINCIIYQK